METFVCPYARGDGTAGSSNGKGDANANYIISIGVLDCPQHARLVCMLSFALLLVICIFLQIVDTGALVLTSRTNASRTTRSNGDERLRHTRGVSGVLYTTTRTDKFHQQNVKKKNVPWAAHGRMSCSSWFASLFCWSSRNSITLQTNQRSYPVGCHTVP